MIQKLPFVGLLLSALFAVSSCSVPHNDFGVDGTITDDVYTKKLTKKEVAGAFATCDLDTEALAQILRSNVEPQISCLEQNLNLFIQVVETEKPGYLSYKRLSEFIQQMMKDVDAGTINALGGIFDLATLLFGEEQGYIKKDNVKPLMTLLIELNRIFVRGDVYNLFTTKERFKFFEHNKRKFQVYRSFKELGIIFGKHFKDNSKKLDLMSFLLRFESVGNQDIIDNAKSLLFLKKAILGGEPGVLTAVELKRAAALFPDLSKVIFDFVNLPDTTNSDANLDEQLLKIYREDVLTAKDNFHFKDRPNEVIFTYYDIKQFVNRFFPDMSEFFIYKDSILKAKKVLFKTSSENFTSEEVMILLDDILYKTFDKGVFFYKYFAQNKSDLLTPLPLRKNFELETFVDFAKESNYMKNFNRISKNYRFYLGNQYLPAFSYDYQRNARGMFEVAVFESIVTRFYKLYGSKNKKSEFGYTLTMDQLEVAMVDFSELFEGKGWITPGRVASTAETITLMTSLFFAQSNGDDLIDVEEFSEFIISMLSALSISTDMFEQMDKFCKADKNGAFSGQCFRDNFRELLGITKDGKRLGDYLPELRTYLSKDKKNPRNIIDMDEYLTKVATFSRTCPYFKNGDERAMTSGDVLVVIAGLLAIEQSVIRFDTNRPEKNSRKFEKQNGILDYKELDAAYSVYGPAVKALAPDFMNKPKQVKRLYLYILKHQRVPEDLARVKGFGRKLKAIRESLKVVYNVGSGLVGERRLRSDADRMTFASVLKIIADNSPATIQMLKDDPEFCERMRDN